MSMVICNEVQWTECIIGHLIYSGGISERFLEQGLFQLKCQRLLEPK